MTYTCAVCATDHEADIEQTAVPIDGDDQPLVCPECVERIAAGVCGQERRNYACLRPPHDDKIHASISGLWTVWWSDDSNGVTLRRRKDVV